MARQFEQEQARQLERGTVSFLYRPRLDGVHVEGIEGVQRLLMVLAPVRRSRFRVVAIGQKRMLGPGRRERFWGFVDLVLDSRTDLRAALDAQVFGTRTRGVRRLPAARPAAEGTYAITWHDGHAHLHYDLTSIRNEDDVVRDLRIERGGDYVITVANPDPTVWGLLLPPDIQSELFDEAEVHVPVPTRFPNVLQGHFRGRKYAQLETTDYLDHPGAELIFIPVADEDSRPSHVTLPSH